ncbi:MAG: DUF4215 domain-containing protein [Polyangiaceae bacterium]
MRTTLTLIGAAAVATSFGLFGCTGSESFGGVEVSGSGGSAGVTTLLPTGHLPVVLPVDGPGTTAPQGGEGGGTTAPQGGGGGETTTAQGGATSTDTVGTGGGTQTITLTGETTTSSSGTATTTTIGNAIAGSDDATPAQDQTPPFPTGGTQLPTSGPPGTPATEPAPGGVEDACPGLGADLAAETVVSFSGRLKGMNDDFSERCSGIATTARGPDVVYQLVVREELTVGIDLVADGFYPVLSIRHHNCESERVDDLCLFTQDVATRAEIALGPGAYWFVVDSGDGRMGDYWLSIKSAKAACGDGVVNPATEECDVGPGQPNDGCYDPGEELGCMYGAPVDTAGLGVAPIP